MNTKNYNSKRPLQLFSKILTIILIFCIGLLLTDIMVLADTVTKPIRTFQGHTNYVESVAFMPDGKTILSGSLDNTIKLWNIETGEEIHSLSEHTGWVMSVITSKKGNMVLSGSYDKTLKLWNTETWQTFHTFKGHTRSIFSVAISPNGKTALSGGGDKTLIFWGLKSKRKLRTFKGHSNVVTSVAFSPNGKMALSGSYDKTLKLWNLKRTQVIRTFQGHSDKIWSVAFSPDGHTCLSGSEDKTIKRWNRNTGKEIHTFQGHTDKVWSVAYSPNGKTFASSSEDNTIRLWDIETEQEIRIFKGHHGAVRNVVFSPDGHTILSGSTDKTLKLWETQNALPKANFIIFPHQGDAPLTVNLDGSLSTDPDGTISKYWWTTTDELIEPLSTETPMTTMTFLQPGTYTINLAVTDSADAISSTLAQQTVRVEKPNIPPIVTFTATPLMGEIPLTVTFDASDSVDTDGSIVNYEWAINGQPVTSGNPATHTFTAFDEYLVELTVTDNQKLTETVQKNIKIMPPNQGPTAYFTTTPAIGPAPLTVILNARDSYDPKGEIVNYEWQINGQKLVGMKASTTLTVPGDYPTVLTVTDNQGAINQIQNNVTVTPSNQAPIADFTATPWRGQVPLTVTLDASSSVDPDGSIVNYQWNANEQFLAYGNPTTHTFTEIGEHLITLTVTDNQDTTTELQKNVSVISSNQTPVARFTVTPSTGEVPLTVTLNASESTDTDGSIVNYQWTKNGELLAYGNPTTHTLVEVGDYLITLTVTDDETATATVQQEVHVTPVNQVPKAHFTVKPLIGKAPLTIRLNASGSFDMDGEIVKYEWAIDEQKLSGVIASITLTRPDEYPIVLTVTDDQGLTAVTQQSVKVTKPRSVEPAKQ